LLYRDPTVSRYNVPRSSVIKRLGWENSVLDQLRFLR